MTIEQMISKLQGMITEKRMRHSLAVRDTAVRLARHYGANEEKAAIAGLIHDCAKGLSGVQLLKLADEFGIFVDIIQQSEMDLLHAPVGAEMARREFEVQDDEIIKAIRYHTTGCEDMNILTKILYIADSIAEGRNFPGIEDLRHTAFTNLDAALLKGMGLTIKSIIAKDKLIYPDTVNARNKILLKAHTNK